MSTRSAFGTLADGKFRGRYIHSDGYPSYNGDQLAKLLARDGAEKVLRVLTEEHYGWSSIDIAQQEGDLGWGQGDGRFTAVPGFGVAYTTAQNQSRADDWVEIQLGGKGDIFIEWMYAIDGEDYVVIAGFDNPREVGRCAIAKLDYFTDGVADVLERFAENCPGLPSIRVDRDFGKLLGSLPFGAMAKG